MIDALRRALGPRIEIHFTDSSLSVADVIERRWWRPAKRYTVALYGGYGGGLWINDDTNDRVDSWVAEELEAARLTGLDIQQREHPPPRR